MLLFARAEILQQLFGRLEFLGQGVDLGLQTLELAGLLLGLGAFLFQLVLSVGFNLAIGV